MTGSTVFDVVQAEALRRPGTEFFKCGGAWRTLPDLVDAARAVAGGLNSIGVSKGDRVAILAANRDEMIDVILGCLALGAIEVPLNAWLKGEFLRYQLADCEATVLIADAAGLAAAEGLLASTSIKHVVALDPPSDLIEAGVAIEPLDQLVAASRDVPAVDLGDSDIAAIIYTSGTTGMPKGCMLSHRYFLTGPEVLVERGWIASGDRLLTAWPLFHTSGQVIAFMSALLANGSVVIEPEFSASGFLARARQERATVLMGVGMMGAAMLAVPDSDTDRNHDLRLAVWVPMAPAAQHQFEERFGVRVTTEAFGQTECFPITMAPIDATPNRSSLGPAAPHVEVALVDANDHPVGPGEVGEIVVRPRVAHGMFSGYWRNADATMAAWRNLWHHTGDLARADEAGNLSFVDRKKDALRRRGENVSSLELEGAILQHPAIAAVAVCGIPSELGEDDVKATVVLAEGAEVTPADLFDFFKASLPYFAIPRYVEVRDALPINALARVMKHHLRAEGVTEATWDLEALGFHVAREERRGR